MKNGSGTNSDNETEVFRRKFIRVVPTKNNKSKKCYPGGVSQTSEIPDGSLKDAKPFRRLFSLWKPCVHRSSNSASLNSLVPATPLIYNRRNGMLGKEESRKKEEDTKSCRDGLGLAVKHPQYLRNFNLD